MLSPSKTSFLAGVTIPAGARVKFLGDGSNTIILAGPTDQEIGTAILFQGRDSYGAGYMVGVALVNDPGTRTLLASGAINQGAPLYKAANGAVSATPAGDYYGIAFDTASDGDQFEGLFYPGGLSQSANKHYLVNGVNSTAGDAPIAIAGVVATDRVTEVINETDNVILTPANFVPGAGFITQKQVAGDLSAKKLSFRTASVPS